MKGSEKVAVGTIINNWIKSMVFFTRKDEGFAKAWYTKNDIRSASSSHSWGSINSTNMTFSYGAKISPEKVIYTDKKKKQQLEK